MLGIAELQASLSFRPKFLHSKSRNDVLIKSCEYTCIRCLWGKSTALCHQQKECRNAESDFAVCRRPPRRQQFSQLGWSYVAPSLQGKTTYEWFYVVHWQAITFLLLISKNVLCKLQFSKDFTQNMLIWKFTDVKL